MAKATGVVNDALEAVVEVEFLVDADGNLAMEIDTGFAGTLLIPREFADKHNLPVKGQEFLRTVEKNEFAADRTTVTIRWLGDEFAIGAIISEHGYALVGAEMLIDAVLTIDYLNKTVLIEK